MLNSLEIQNYRNLKHLKIDKLGRVNLIVGKNNTGKSSVLEAVVLFFSYDNLDFFGWVDRFLISRGEKLVEGVDFEKQEQTIASLFYKKRVSYFDANLGIKIGKLNEEHPLVIRLVKVLYQKDDEMKIAKNEEEIGITPFSVELLGQKDEKDFVSLILSEKVYRRRLSREFTRFPFGLVGAAIVNAPDNGQLWDQVALRKEKRKKVFEALKIIEPKIENLHFEGGLKPFVLLTGEEDPIPLRSMGDGINRILTIVLAMVNCENGYLLIDEFENGLHYSVQEKLWEIIFHLAERLNVQVFATTHSYDCIDAFSEILNGGKYPKESGVMVRLDNYEDNIEATVYEADEIHNTTRLHVDPR
jgi:AAA15 family ATPase/GTPase